MNNSLLDKIPSPAYVIEEKKLRKNLALISSVKQQADVNIILAFKAFANWKLFPIFQEYIQGATASSLYEAMLCNEEMNTLSHTYAPAYLPKDFPDILRRSSHITFNSISQYYTFKKQIDRVKLNVPKFALRINPQYSEVQTELYNPCAQGSRLGEIHSNLPEILPSDISGLHFHNLCESDSYALEKTLQNVEKLFAPYLKQISWINMGGGHLMTKEGYDTEHLIKILKAFKEEHDLEIILEPGAAFVWQTGFLKSTVLDIVENNGIKTAMLDVSFTAHMPDTLEMPYRPKVSNAVTQSPYPFRLGGVSCLAGDYMENYYFKKPLQVGDTLLFEDMIHYTMVKSTMFNGVKHPSLVLINSDEKVEILKTYSYQDFKQRL